MCLSKHGKICCTALVGIPAFRLDSVHQVQDEEALDREDCSYPNAVVLTSEIKLKITLSLEGERS